MADETATPTPEDETPAAEVTETPAAAEPATEPTASTDAAPTAATDDAPAAVETPEIEPVEVEEPLPELTIGTDALAEFGLQPDLITSVRGKVDRFGVAMGTGRRKTSVARVRIKQGDGKFEVNGRELDQYFCVERDRAMIMAPLEKTGAAGKVDVWVRVKGGGTTGQTGALVLGIARALEAMDPELHDALAEGGFLTRDERMVERKKYGLAKARRSFQFSKR